MNPKLQESLALVREAVTQTCPYPDMKPVVLRDYLVQYRMVETVDNQGQSCGYCEERPIICNVYATTNTLWGHVEQQCWSTCDTCVIHSIDGVEDVATEYLIIVERAQR